MACGADPGSLRNRFLLKGPSFDLWPFRRAFKPPEAGRG
ncbi:hypothetical protein [Azospirillum argentinense]|uniref:Uncharacterized protein n=1 Tax=Azospirillum argentinense TaxID=2970906 RepID=A0A5B0KZS1_9PROT|nr:hypothetical protein FH063_000417 [Azospirillum argentinense]